MFVIIEVFETPDGPAHDLFGVLNDKESAIKLAENYFNKVSKFVDTQVYVWEVAEFGTHKKFVTKFTVEE